MDHDAKREQTELATLVSLSTLVNSSLDIEVVMNNALKCVEEFMNAEASSIFELDRERGELFFRLARGDRADQVREIRIRLGEGVAGWVAMSGEPVIIADAEHDSRFDHRADAKSGFRTRSILCVPLISKGKLLGVVQVLNKKSDKGFNDKDLRMMLVLSNQIATALENAKLYGQLNERFELTKEELKVTQERLIRSERLAALGKLSEGVAHEVRNPVMVIGGFSRRLQKHLASDAEALDKLGIILNETGRLERLVEDVERYTGLREPVLAPMDLREAIARVLARNRDALDAQKVRVIRQFPSPMPEVLGDEELLELAVDKVIENSLEAMPEGGEMKLSIEPQADTVLLTVRDTGMGIPPEDLASVFDPFFTSKTRGTGLGLTTVYRIISQHDGEIDIRSDPGKGTVVTIHLPRAPLSWDPLGA